MRTTRPALCLALWLVAAAAQAAWPLADRSVRVLDLPVEANEYGAFASQVIDTPEQYEAFVQLVTDKADGKRPEFLRVLDGIDFARESLVLIRQGDGSGDMKVTLAEPRLFRGTLTCVVRIGGTHRLRNMEYRCFAVVVGKAKVRQVRIQASEGWWDTKTETLPVGRP